MLDTHRFGQGSMTQQRYNILTVLGLTIVFGGIAILGLGYPAGLVAAVLIFIALVIARNA